jgi:hypothetical protein
MFLMCTHVQMGRDILTIAAEDANASRNEIHPF